MNAPKFILDLLAAGRVKGYTTHVHYLDDEYGAMPKSGLGISIYDMNNAGFFLTNAYAIPIREGDVIILRRVPRRDIWILDEKQIVSKSHSLYLKSCNGHDTSEISLWRHAWSPYLLEIPGIVNVMTGDVRELYMSYPDRAKPRSEGNINFSQPLPLP